MTDLSLSGLLRSTRDLHWRFGVNFDVEVCERLVTEESYELIKASVEANFLGFNVDGKPFRFESDIDALVEEAVDLFVVTLALLQAHGVSDDDLAQAIADVIQKNDAKTSETHTLVNGKISRREVQA